MKLVYFDLILKIYFIFQFNLQIQINPNDNTVDQLKKSTNFEKNDKALDTMSKIVGNK